MSYTTYDGIYAFAKTAVTGLYLNCRTAIFNNPENQIYTPKGKITKVREISAGKAGTYSKTNGWMNTYGAGDGVKWVDYYAPYDRAKVIRVDAVDEIQSFETGMRPSIEVLNENFLDEFLPAEIDATNIASWYSKIPSGNKHLSSESGYEVTADGILGTLIKLELMIFNSGYAGDSVLFVRADTYANLKTAIINKYGLAGLMTKTMTVSMDTGLSGLMNDANGAISLSTEVVKFNKFFVIEMPDDRMATKITMLDGQSVGQEDGGYAVDTDSVGSGNIELLAIPYNGAFTNTRYAIDNLLVPYNMQAQLTAMNLDKLTSRMYGNIEIGNVGVNQKANAFEYDIRAIYGGDIFTIRRKNCFAITGTLKTV